jgi:hypothetical protein
MAKGHFKLQAYNLTEKVFRSYQRDSLLFF